MEISGNIRKMRSILNNPVEYLLPVGEAELKMNDLLGKNMRIEYTGEINCIKCGKKTSKSFSQGFCYPCFITAPETEDCVLRPELCRAHEGVARDMDYARQHCLIEQVVYLSITSDLKVGVTRSSQVPFRWIDQGAVSAIEIARTPNRYLAGIIEVSLKAYMKDKTNWRAMLKNEIYNSDLRQQKDTAIAFLPGDLVKYASVNNYITEINYPVLNYPQKLGSLNLDTDPVYSGTLSGIKGQYLIFADGKVINIRKFGGYKVKISA